MELLAPAGNLDNFQAAVEAGADAVYVGAPGFNARNLARDLRLEEIGAMIDYCRSHDKKFYLAANSLILENELPKVIETLALFEKLNPDALIVQDLGLIQLVRSHFPGIVLHASTLMTAHNIDSVNLFSLLGCERVVLARELTLKEIARIASSTEAELEVFVHGAMCYSYSGLCMFSSYLGGKSGLRGRCVQPCRRKYSQQGNRRGGGKKGASGTYPFSMNDLSGFQAIPTLREAGVASLKIEGRLRSAHYVSNVVKAYRTVVDAEKENFNEAVSQAMVLAREAMSRKVSSGFFFTPQPQDAIIPHHSGNIGEYLGSFGKIDRRGETVTASLEIRMGVGVGDRLRLHFERTGKSKAFSLKELFSQGVAVKTAEPGERVKIVLPEDVLDAADGKIELYRVDISNRVSSKKLQLPISKIKKQLYSTKRDLLPFIRSLQKQSTRSQGGEEISKGHVSKGAKGQHQVSSKGKGRTSSKKFPLGFWIKIDNIKTLQHKFPFTPDQYLIPLEQKFVSQASQIKKMLGKGSRKVIWALPPVVMDTELQRLHKNIRSLMRNGFKGFQVAHLSQVNLFGGERVHLYGDFTLNLLNNQSLMLASEVGFAGVQLSIEGDKECLQALISGHKEVSRRVKHERKENVQIDQLGLTVYGAPSLFIARLSIGQSHSNATFISPKDESFKVIKKEGMTHVVPRRPFSLLPYLREIKNLGVDYVIVDLTGVAGRKDLEEVCQRIQGAGKFSKLPTFNYLGKLI